MLNKWKIMTQKILLVTLTLALLGYPSFTLVKPIKINSSLSTPQINLAPDVFLNKGVIYLRKGEIMTGLLLAVDAVIDSDAH